MQKEEVIAVTKDAEGAYVVVLARIWHDKILVDHREMAWLLPEVLSTVAAPDHVEPDPKHLDRILHFARNVGPSRWLLVVVKLRTDSGTDHHRTSTPKGPSVVEIVNLNIGPLSFRMADYDAESDVLYLHVNTPEPAEAEQTPEGHAIRYEFGTDRVVGLTMISPRYILEHEGRLTVTLPDVGEQVVTEVLADALVAT